MLIKESELSDELVVKIGKFAILWNCFEDLYCDNDCSVKKIKKIAPRLSVDKIKQAELATVLNKRRDWFGPIISEYVKTGLYPENARQNSSEDKKLMEQFLEQGDGDLRCGCLLSIYRIRNNLMHGLKKIIN